MRAVGFTCGIGSMLIGARQAGFKVVGNIEWRPYYHFRDEEGRNTFEMNFPDAAFARNLFDLSPNFLEKFYRADLAMGHPECGNFSVMNQNRCNTETNCCDIPLFVDLVKSFKPRFFVQDNLPRSFIAYPISKWSEELPEYDLFPEWISNYHYGNIQKSRNRLMLIGALKSENFIFVPGEENQTHTLKSVLSRCEGLPNHNDHVSSGPCGKNRFNWWYPDKKYGEQVNEKIDDEGTWEDFQRYFLDKPEGHVMQYVTKKGIVRRRIGTSKGYWNGHSHLLDGSSLCSHPRKNLPFTLRERARIQGCPDDFIFYGEKLPWNHEKNPAMIKQTGKFMPVEFCYYIADQIKHHIEGKKFKASGQRLIKPNKYIEEARKWLKSKK